MAREYARVKVTIWADADFRTLTPAAQHLYFLLLTSPTLTLAGIADWRPARLSKMAAGLTGQQIREAANELSGARYIVVDDDTDEILVRSFIRHDGVIKSPNLTRAMVKSYAAAGSETIREAILTEVRRALEEDPEAKGGSEAMGILNEPQSNHNRTNIEPFQNGSKAVPKEFEPFENSSPIPHTAYNNPHPSASRPEQSTSPDPRPASPADAGDMSSTSPFDDFWELYPRKASKGRARTAFIRATTGQDATDPDTILDGLRAALPSLTDTQDQYRPHPATWLDDERWADSPSRDADPWSHLPSGPGPDAS